VGAFSCGYVARLTGDIRLERFNSGIAEIDGCSGNTLRLERFQRRRFEESFYLLMLTGLMVPEIYGCCGLSEYFRWGHNKRLPVAFPPLTVRPRLCIVRM
jgi:hypothetical protein